MKFIPGMLKPFTQFSLVMGLVVMLVMSACSSPQSMETATTTTTATASPEPEPTSTLEPATATPEIMAGTVTIWHSLGDTEIQTLVRVIADFQNIYPDSQFDVLYLPEEILLNRYQMAHQEGRAPALLIGPLNWVPELASGDWVQDLEPILSPDLKEQINPAALQTAYSAGRLTALPYTMEGVVLYRNGNLVLETPATWDELVELSLNVTQGEVIGAYLDRGFYYSAGHLYANGGALFNPDGSPAFNSPEGLEWISLLQSFETAGPVDFLTDNDIERFKQSLVGFVVGTTTAREQLAEAVGSTNLKIDRWPAGLSGFVIPEMVYLNNQVSGMDANLAGLFLEFMLSPEAQLHFASIGRIPVVDLPEGAASTMDPLTQKAWAALLDGSPYPPDDLVELYSTALNEALQAIFRGDLTPQEGLSSAETVIMEAQAAAPDGVPPGNQNGEQENPYP